MTKSKKMVKMRLLNFILLIILASELNATTYYSFDGDIVVEDKVVTQSHGHFYSSYDPFLQHRTIYDSFEKFVRQKDLNSFFKCIHDETWRMRRIAGEKNSSRFIASPLLILDFLEACHSKDAQKQIIDLGGADGRVTELALFTGAKVHLLDRNMEEIEEGRERITRRIPQDFGQNFTLECKDVLDISSDVVSQYDCVYVGNLLHFFAIDQMDKFFEILNRILKPKGKVFCQLDALYGLPLEKYQELQLKSSRVKNNKYSYASFYKEDTEHYLFTLATAAEIFEKNGFSILKNYYIDPFTFAVNSNITDELELRICEASKVNLVVQKISEEN